MRVMENSLMVTPLLLLRNLITPLLSPLNNKPFISLSHKSKLINLILHLLGSLLHSLSSFLPYPLSYSTKHDSDNVVFEDDHVYNDNDLPGIGRALEQTVSLVGVVPVSSRKYDVVRSIAEKLMDDNLHAGSCSLREVNCAALSKAFCKTMAQLEGVLLGLESGVGLGLREFGLVRAAKVVKGWCLNGGGGGGAGMPVEKMVAEMLWLAGKLEESGGVEVVVRKWAWASNLGWLGLSAEPRVQASLVKLTAFLIKQAKVMGKGLRTEGGERDQQQKETKIKMLLTWLPLLCRANNGFDVPTLGSSERGEVEKAMEEMIDTIEEDEIQGKILSLWLHHFTMCPSSDWPNLYCSYMRWCNVSRKLLLAQ